MKSHKFRALLLLSLFFLSVFALLPQPAQATTNTETRYLLNLSDWYYGPGFAYPFFMANATEASGSNYVQKSVATATTTVDFGIRVYRNYYDPTIYYLADMYEELTSGVAFLFQRSGDSEGYQSATWNCPAWNISRKDTVQVMFYTRFGTGSWFQLQDPTLTWGSVFGTEPLGYDSISEATWNFTLYTYRSKPAGTATARIYFGNSTYNSRIENIQFDDGVTTPTEENITAMAPFFIMGALIMLPIGILLGKKT